MNPKDPYDDGILMEKILAELHAEMPIDVPTHPVQRYVRLLLFGAKKSQATQLVIGGASAREETGTPVRYESAGEWHDMAPFPSHFRAAIAAELARMAHLPVHQFPREGFIEVVFGGVAERWHLVMAGADVECILSRVKA